MSKPVPECFGEEYDEYGDCDCYECDYARECRVLCFELGLWRPEVPPNAEYNPEDSYAD